MSDGIHVTTDLLRQPWHDISHPAFGRVERVGFLPGSEGAPSNVALLVRLENGQWAVGMIELSLYVKASTVMQRIHVERQT